MKATALGVLIGAGLCVFTLGSLPAGTPAHAQRESGWSQTASSELIALSHTLANNRQQVTLIDPQLRTISVYHIDESTGDVALRCVRNFQWDTQMIEFNGTKPLPREVRSLVEQR
jgi:hypothetical protein